MENFVAAVIILTAVFIFTAVNSFVICGYCDDITALIDSGDIQSACTEWEKRRAYISFFVRDYEIDSADAAAASAQSGNGRALRDAITEIRDCEFPSFCNLF